MDSEKLQTIYHTEAIPSQIPREDAELTAKELMGEHTQVGGVRTADTAAKVGQMLSFTEVHQRNNALIVGPLILNESVIPNGIGLWAKTRDDSCR